MGMQCYFNVKDVPDFTKVISYDYETECYSYTMHDDWVVDCDIEGDAWFDIGQMSDKAMANLRYLIMHRIYFTCS